MPKFNIYATAQPGVNVETGEVVAVTPRRISVGWSKGQYAQLGVGHAFDPKLDGGRRSHAGVPVDGAVLQVGEAEADREWVEEWIDIDRHMINQLIRELRKARDEAFGRDE